MSVTAIVVASDSRQGAKLSRRQQSIRDRHAQHRRMALDVQAVAQPQMLEFVLAQRPLEESLRLIAKLCHPLTHESLVGEVVPIHEGTILCPPGVAPIPRRHELMTADPCQSWPILVNPRSGSFCNRYKP